MNKLPEGYAQNEYSFFRDLFLATAMKTCEMILSLDLDTMVCTTLLASPEGFRQEGAPEPWAEKHRRLMAAIHPEDREQMEEHWQQEGGKYGEANPPFFTARFGPYRNALVFFTKNYCGGDM